jgi:hypothetical protein
MEAEKQNNPEETLINPEETLINPEETLINPEETLINPEETLINPEETLINPTIVNFCFSFLHAGKILFINTHTTLLTKNTGHCATERSKGIYNKHKYSSRPIPQLPFPISSDTQVIEMINGMNASQCVDFCYYLNNTNEGMKVLNIIKGVF